MTKKTFRENEAIFIEDFAKDYQFLIQDDIQSCLGPGGSLQHDSICFISDSIIVQAFCIKFKQCSLIILKLISHIRKKLI